MSGILQAGLLHGHFLELAGGLGREGVEHRAHRAALDAGVHVLAHHGAGHVEAHGNQIELADFFVQVHFRHQVRDELIHLGLIVGGGGGYGSWGGRGLRYVEQGREQAQAQQQGGAERVFHAGELEG